MARIGTFSEFVVCPAEQAIRIREDLPFTHAAIIGCSVATGVGAVIRHARVATRRTIQTISGTYYGSVRPDIDFPDPRRGPCLDCLLVAPPITVEGLDHVILKPKKFDRVAAVNVDEVLRHLLLALSKQS